MSRQLRFMALALPNASWEVLLERFKRVEALGFDVVATADHFVDWTNPPSPWFDLPTLLAAMARETIRIRLASCVAQIPLRDPATMARQALAVDHMSAGRLELGLGIGLMTDPSYEMMGVPGWTLKERVARFKEYVEIVDRLLTNEVSSYEGAYYQIKDAYMNPRPVQSPRPPILIAAMGAKMLKIAAEHADIWNSMSFLDTFDEQLEQTRVRIDAVREHCQVCGRDPSSLRMSYHMFDPSARTSGGAFNYYESDDLFMEMVERAIDLGITEFGMYYPMLDAQLPAFQRVATEIIPKLKKRFAA